MFYYNFIYLCLCFTLAHTVLFNLNLASIQSNTGENMICFGFDWWPRNKCNYGLCPWEHASVLNMDLNNVRFKNVLSSFPGSVTIRIGGYLQDNIVYKMNGQSKDCPEFSPLPPKPAHIFKGGCLTQKRWDEILDFASETNVNLVFGLNAKHSFENDDGIEWDGSNSKQLIEYTMNRGFAMYGYELGNELSYNASVFAKRYHQLNGIINDVFNQSLIRKPKIIGTDGIELSESFFKSFLPKVNSFLFAMTWHTYPLGMGYNNSELDEHILNPHYNLRFLNKAKLGTEIANTFGNGHLEAWMGETGGCANSGHNGTSNRYIDAFWYLDSLGGFALNGHTKFCRQTLYGGFYELLQRNTFEPNPDFYGAWLFQYLMGNGAFNLSTFNSTSRVYAHCSRRGPSGTIAVLAINFAKTETATFDFEFEGSSNVREEYHMTPSNGDLHSKTVLLNGVPLKTKDNKMPKMTPLRIFGSTKPVSIEPLSYSFIYYPNARVRQCMDVEAW